MADQDFDLSGVPQKKRASLEKLTDDEKLEKRRERLVGRTVKGVLIRNRQNFAIKWNDCQFDNVYISQRCVELCLGPRPERGIVAVVKCEIKTIGPTNAPWYLQHPYTDVVELVTRYRRKKRQSMAWMHSGMPKALNKIQFSRDSSTEASRNASIVVSRRGTVVNDDSELPDDIQVIASRRGSEVIIEGGKRWEYKPPVRGPMRLPQEWEIRSIRFNGATYFVPSPPGSRRNSYSRAAARRSSRKRGKRSSRGARGPKRKPSKKSKQASRSRQPSAADKAAAVALIKQIEKEERNEADRERRKSRSKSAKKKSKSKSPKKEQRKQKSKSARKSVSSQDDDWECRKCSHHFHSEAGLNDHLQDKHNVKRRLSTSGKKATSTKKEKKSTSNKKQQKSRSARKSTQGSDWECKKCSHHFNSEMGLNDHLWAKHSIKRRGSKSSAKPPKKGSRKKSPTRSKQKSKLRRATGGGKRISKQAF